MCESDDIFAPSDSASNALTSDPPVDLPLGKHQTLVSPSSSSVVYTYFWAEKSGEIEGMVCLRHYGQDFPYTIREWFDRKNCSGHLLNRWAGRVEGTHVCTYPKPQNEVLCTPVFGKKNATKFDLGSIFWHLELPATWQRSTNHGRCRWKLINFGLKAIKENFQKKIL